VTTIVRDTRAAHSRVRALTPLVTAIQSALRDRPTGVVAAQRAAQCLLSHPPTIDLLSAEQRQGDPDAYRQHVLFVDERARFSIVALVWRPGQRTAIHDHRCWGAVAVVQGSEHETLYALQGNGTSQRLVTGRQSVYPTGDVCAFAPPGDIHRVRNPGPGIAMSIHVYGADIARCGSSIRRTYPDELIASSSAAITSRDVA
jgi:3-mercaptopropionate dioxygenase